MVSNNEKEVDVKLNVDDTKINKALKLMRDLEETYKRVQSLRKELDLLGDIEINVTSEVIQE